MERQLKGLEKDTYKVRKAEQRPKHGQTSFTILGLGAVSWLVLVVAVAMPEWRSNWIGVLGYTSARSWGLFQVVGMTTITHTEAYSNACRYSSQLSVGGICASPICLWYRKKCWTYMTLCWVSYGSAFFLIICIILHALCLIWTMRMTPRMIRWAAIWWTAQTLIHFCVVAFWVMMTSEAFQDLDSDSMYPEPNFSMCFYAECFVILCDCTLVTLGMTLMKMWPESSSESSGSDSEDESADDYGTGWKGGMKGPPPGKGMMKGDPGMKGPPGKGGFDPNMGPPPGYQGGK